MDNNDNKGCVKKTKKNLMIIVIKSLSFKIYGLFEKIIDENDRKYDITYLSRLMKCYKVIIVPASWLKRTSNTNSSIC